VVPGEVPAGDWPVFRISWPGLNVASIENARAAVTVRRNQSLGGIQAMADFVLTTATVKAPDLAVPMLQWEGDFALGGTDLGSAVQAAFASLFGSAAGLPITISGAYRYALVPAGNDGPGLVTTLPVALGPRQTLGPLTGSNVAAALSAWQSAHLPATEGGEWAVGLILYSQLDKTGSRPLLVLDRLVRPL
jgi:hypothetical protein